ncbi:MAG: cellulase family glycosylhydrolase [Thermoleophilaceae bacterium]
MPDLTWGIGDSELAQTQAAISDLGAKWVRLEFRWNEGEPRRDFHDNGTLRKWDRAVETADAAGARIVAVVHSAPSWASGAGDAYGTPSDPRDFAAFMRFLADRYRGQVAAWEIWNEPNATRFWPTGPNAAEYVDLLRPAHAAVKESDPNALVVFGGTSYNDYEYVERAYAAGAQGHFDVMAVHPYSDQWSPDQVWHSGGRQVVKTFTAYREVRKSMLANGDDKPIWFTEFGWSTTTGTAGVTQVEQAEYLARALCIVEHDPYVQVALWYNLRNNHWNDDADQWETQLGLMKTTFERKPAYTAFKNHSSGACPSSGPAPDPPRRTDDAAPEPPELPLNSGPALSPPLASAVARLAPPRLGVGDAILRDGLLALDARVARGATGTVYGVVSLDGRRLNFAAPVDSQGRIRVRQPLPRGENPSTAWVGLLYGGNARFHRQWVVLRAAPRAARLRVQHEAAASGAERAWNVGGSVVSEARGSVVLVLGYRTAHGGVRSVTRRARIRGGRFHKSLRLPAGARDGMVSLLYAGDPSRGIGGGSATFAL